MGIFEQKQNHPDHDGDLLRRFEELCLLASVEHMHWRNTVAATGYSADSSKAFDAIRTAGSFLLSGERLINWVLIRMDIESGSPWKSQRHKSRVSARKMARFEAAIETLRAQHVDLVKHYGLARYQEVVNAGGNDFAQEVLLLEVWMSTSKKFGIGNSVGSDPTRPIFSDSFTGDDWSELWSFFDGERLDQESYAKFRAEKRTAIPARLEDFRLRHPGIEISPGYSFPGEDREVFNPQ